MRDAPWVITPEFLEAHGIDYVAHDALPYSDAQGGGDDVYALVRQIWRPNNQLHPEHSYTRGSRVLKPEKLEFHNQAHLRFRQCDCASATAAPCSP